MVPQNYGNEDNGQYAGQSQSEKHPILVNDDANGASAGNGGAGGDDGEYEGHFKRTGKTWGLDKSSMIDAVQKCQERSFDEDVVFLAEQCGGTAQPL